MVQCENEYGSYVDVSKHPTDMQYMKYLITLARDALGPDVILFTTDGGDEGYMTRGSIKGDIVYTVGDGCGNPATCVAAQKVPIALLIDRAYASLTMLLMPTD